MLGKSSLISSLALVLLLAPVNLQADPTKGKKGQKSLPPGLQKKADQGQVLPPGWQKKLKVGTVLEQDVFRRARIEVPLAPDGSIVVRVEDRLLRLHEKTLKILDILL